MASLPTTTILPPSKTIKAAVITLPLVINELRGLLDELWSVGIATFLAALEDDVIYLALQPDSWGKRTKARLIPEIAPALQPAASGHGNINAQYITECVNIWRPVSCWNWTGASISSISNFHLIRCVLRFVSESEYPLLFLSIQSAIVT